MVLTYVFDVTEPFTDEGVDARRNDVFVWRPPEVYQFRTMPDGREFRWRHPLSHTFVLMKYEDRLRCRDERPPRLIDLARRVASGQPLRPLARPSSARPHLRLVE